MKVEPRCDVLLGCRFFDLLTKKSKGISIYISKAPSS